MEFLDGLVRAGDVGERRLRGVLGDELGLGLPEVHDPGAAALHLVHQEQEDDHDEDEGEQGQQDPDEGVLLRRRDGVAVRDLLVLVLGLQRVGDRHALIADVARLDLRAALDLHAVFERGLDGLLVTGGEFGRLDLVVVDRCNDLAGVHRLVAAGRADDLHQHDHGKDGQHDPHDRPTEVSLHVHPYGAVSPRPSCHSEFDKTVLLTVPQLRRAKPHGTAGAPVCMLQRREARRGSRSSYGAWAFRVQPP
ncbi:hypothetical protein QFZ66_003887 [Streptomyces sp. B4I13]|nr:hypothetical protein [Streptomyces sp. B4I13]